MKIGTVVVFGILTLLAFSALAETTVSWTPRTEKIVYSSLRAYYSCDYAEQRAKHYAEILGAKDVEVRCTGGLPEFTSINIDVTFLAPTVTFDGDVATWQPVSIKTRESCDFNEMIAKRIMKAFPTREMTTQSSCWNAEGSFSYDFEVLR
jgi:hypothetical protein